MLANQIYDITTAVHGISNRRRYYAMPLRYDAFAAVFMLVDATFSQRCMLSLHAFMPCAMP